MSPTIAIALLYAWPPDGTTMLLLASAESPSPSAISANSTSYETLKLEDLDIRCLPHTRPCIETKG